MIWHQRMGNKEFGGKFSYWARDILSLDPKDWPDGINVSIPLAKELVLRMLKEAKYMENTGEAPTGKGR